MAHPWLILGSLIWFSSTYCFGQTIQVQSGFVSLSSIVFKKGEPGFIDFVNDISEMPYDHSSGISDIENHHARYEFDPFYSQVEGLNKQARPIDGTLAPAVVYVSGSNPVMGATFYARCSDALSITPTWRYQVDGMNYEMKFPEQRCVPQGVFSSSGIGPQFIAQYNFKESEDSFPLGWTLAFEGTSTIAFEIKNYQAPVLPGSPPSPQGVPELTTTLTGTVDTYILAQAHTSSTILTSRGGSVPLFTDIVVYEMDAILAAMKMIMYLG